MRSLVVITLGATALFASTAASADPAVVAPPCSSLGFDQHGQHVLGDYITGLGDFLGDGTILEFPPDGRLVGETISENGGPVVRGGPSHPDGHFPPGASGCVQFGL